MQPISSAICFERPRTTEVEQEEVTVEATETADSCVPNVSSSSGRPQAARRLTEMYARCKLERARADMCPRRQQALNHTREYGCASPRRARVAHARARQSHARSLRVNRWRANRDELARSNRACFKSVLRVRAPPLGIESPSAAFVLRLGLVTDRRAHSRAAAARR